MIQLKVKTFAMTTALGLSVMLSYQNCSDVNFQSSPLNESQSPSKQGPTDSTVCQFNGKEYLPGDVIQTFQNSSVEFGQNCVAQTHVCQDDGRFSGQLKFPDCSIGAPKDCMISGTLIRHNDSLTRFQSTQVVAPALCQSEVRRCQDGVLSGSFTAASCQQVVPQPTGKLRCLRRLAAFEQPPAIRTLSMTGEVGVKEDIYERWSDDSYHLVEKCLDWQSSKENPALNCGSEISGTDETNFGVILRGPICCPEGRVAINGACQTENGLGGYCYADSQCRAGLECSLAAPTRHTCQRKP